jgi:hypothetical protein
MVSVGVGVEDARTASEAGFQVRDQAWVSFVFRSSW